MSDGLEYLADAKGIYGLEWPNRRHVDNGGDIGGCEPRMFRYVLRPDKLGDCEGILRGAAALQPVPHLRGPFAHVAEREIARDLGQLLVNRAGLRVGQVGKLHGCQLREGCRQQYWGLIRRGERISNGLVARLIDQAADPEALRVARRFPLSARWPIYRDGARHPYVLQLAETFPSLARYILFEKRTGAAEPLALVKRGAPLKQIAALCMIPMPLRHVPPGATGDLSHLLDVFRDRPDFVNFMPATVPAIRRWLRAIRVAKIVAGGPYVEWAARHGAGLGSRLIEVESLVSDFGDWVKACYAAEAAAIPSHVIRALGVVVNDRDDNGAEYVTRHFNPAMSPATVIQLSAEWHEAVAEHATASKAAFPTPWCPGGTVNGFEIVPIDNPTDLWREGKALHHCANTYAPHVAAGSCYLYSVRHSGDRIATVELIRSTNNRASLGQVRGPCNAQPSKATMATLRKWLRSQSDFCLPSQQSHSFDDDIRYVGPDIDDGDADYHFDAARGRLPAHRVEKSDMTLPTLALPVPGYLAA